MTRALTNSGELQSQETCCTQTISMPRPHRLAFVAPRHADHPEWPWISRIGPMRRFEFERIYINNTFRRFPKLTRFYIGWQHLRALLGISSADLAFFFSTDVNLGMTRWLARLMPQPKRVYVGFTQDGDWPQRKVRRLSAALRQLDAVTVFSHDERRLYIARYGLNPERVHVIPIHTDEPDGYEHYNDPLPMEQPYVLSMGSPNRRFLPIAKACRALKIPLVIITRPMHRNDSLDELKALGATIITNAGRREAFTYLQHATLCAMVFQTPLLPGAFTTLIHAMNLRTPFVVSSCLGVEDYVVDGQTGFVVPHGDDAKLTDRVAQLWGDQRLRDHMTCAGITRARQQFSLEAAAEQFGKLTEHLLNKHHVS